MEFVEVTSKSSPERLNELVGILMDQMRAIGAERDERYTRKALERALRPGSSTHFFLLYDED